MKKGNSLVHLTIPNQISIARIFLIPIFIISLYIPWDYQNILSAVIFLIIALSDHLDGYLARKLNQVTDFGKLIDPLADKLLITAALLFLIGREPVGVPAWIAFLIIARELLITGLRSIDTKKVILSASGYGKLKTNFQMIGILAVLLNLEISYWLLVIAAVLSWVSGIDYIIKARKIIKRISS